VIAGLTEEQFNNLPPVALHYPCDKCDKRHDSGRLIRDIADYGLQDGEVTEKTMHTALYLCGACHWQMTCEYTKLDKDLAKQLDAMRENEARWLLFVSGLTVQELACKVDVSRQAYYKWLRGGPILEKHKVRLRELIISQGQKP
jgi:DNA-binding XRE family transcriptional regulator